MINLNYLRFRFLKPLKAWKNKYLKHITKKEAKKYDLYHKIAKEISEYTNESIGVVKQKHKLGPGSERNFNLFKEQNNLTEIKVKEFYQNCAYYIYELPLWNAERNRPRYLYLVTKDYLKRNDYNRVMDFGAGTGDLCIELISNDLDVTYCDIGGRLYNFAQWRFKKRNLPIKMVKWIDHLKNEVYDCIFSFDTFEHIKNLPGMLEILVKHIRPAGSLIFSGAFRGGTLHLEENEKYNDFKNLDKLMRSCGLTFQDKFAQFYFYKVNPGKVKRDL